MHMQKRKYIEPFLQNRVMDFDETWFELVVHSYTFGQQQYDTNVICLQYKMHDKHSSAYYDVDINSTRKSLLSFNGNVNVSIIYQI